jgi:hypothetical protein
MRSHRALRRRYGRASGPRVVYRSPTGLLVWAVPHTSLQIMWAGPGARLKIGHPMKAGGSMFSIEHPSADGAYDSARAASAAVKKFLEAHTHP